MAKFIDVRWRSSEGFREAEGHGQASLKAHEIRSRKTGLNPMYAPITAMKITGFV
ncbi:hypothetical protein [Erythrobacter rubeus]|uniref:Uncharacterized protein n=1 Tax=Erythrobacter rubeus TaxID=2760803 RepID=A0ABR8KQJ1_9SPHN|nr:hypothetical protein [Erythrobacter rubeus]MBD2842994.1 hypothetical protein [Erythrobacter rubeus]